MIFSIRRDYLQALLEKAAVVSGVVDDIRLKSFMLQLEGEPSSPDEAQLTVLRTDTELSVIASTKQIEIRNWDEPKRVLIRAELLMGLVGSLECESLEFSLTESNEVNIAAGGYHATWTGLLLSSFPKLPRDFKDTVVAKVSSKEFVKAVDRVKYIVPSDYHQKNTLNAFFDSSGCWGYDGWRYQRVSIKTDNLELRLPRKAFGVTRFIQLSGVSEFSIGIQDNLVFFLVGGDVLVCKNKKIEPPVVQYMHVIDRGRQGHFEFEIDQFKKMVTRIGVTSDVKSKRIEFEVKERSITLHSKDNFGNRSEEKMAIVFQGKQEMRKKFGLDWEWVVEGLGVVTDKSAKLFIDERHVILESSDSYSVIPMATE